MPYGYHLVFKGRKNKKGQEVRDAAIHPEESEILKTVFHKTLYEGCGSYQIASYLNNFGLKTRSGAKFQSNNVIRMLKSEMCIGYIVNGTVRSIKIPELQLINEDEYFKVQEILKQRSGKCEEKGRIAKNNKACALLSGNIFCAHCGGRLITSRYKDSYTRADGSEYRVDQVRCLCYHKSRKLTVCNGATTYLSDKIDNLIIDIMKTIFANISGCPKEEKIQAVYRKTMQSNHKLQQKLTLEIQKDTSQLEKLRHEIANALTGNSLYSSEDLSEAINGFKTKISESEVKLRELKGEDSKKKLLSDSVIPAYKQFKSWVEEFDSSTLEGKRMIASQLFSKIEIGKDYEIKIELDMTYKQFCDEWVKIATA